MKNIRYAAFFSFICYLCTAFFFSLTTCFLWLKYCSFAGMLFYMTRYGLERMRLRVKKRHPLMRMFGSVVLGCWAVLCLDTFVFHAWLPISGMVRYALFDYYLFSAPLFILPGVLAYYGSYEIR